MERSYYRRPYAIKNQRGATKIPPMGTRGLWMPELVLSGIRRLAKQFFGTVLDMEVDQSGKKGGYKNADSQSAHSK